MLPLGFIATAITALLSPLYKNASEMREIREKLEVRIVAVLTEEFGNQTVSTNGTECQLQRFYLNFKKVGIDFICSPEGVEFGLCAGDCGAELTLRELLMKEAGAPMKRNCVEDGYIDAQVYFLNEEKKLIETKLSKVIATGCSCG